MSNNELELYEALLVAAKNLRNAQRAYMADRGNEELGRAVGDRARELDDVIEALS